MTETDVATRKDAALKLNFFSHATIDTSDIARSRKFYEEFMGFDVVQTFGIVRGIVVRSRSAASVMCRLIEYLRMP